MNYFRYLFGHIWWAIITFFLILTIDIFMLTINGSQILILYTSIAIILGMFIGSFLDYCSVYKYLRDIKKIEDSLDKKYLLPEMIANPENVEQRMIKDIMGDMEISMADNVSMHRRFSDEYKEYIETWVHEVKIPIATAEMIITNHSNELLGETGIDSEIKRISGYVEQALYYARSENVEKDYFIKKVNVSELVGSVILENKKALRSMGASINIHDCESDIMMLTDSKWMAFIIGQIVTNSIKYAKKDEKLCLEIFCTKEQNKVTLHIKDNGIGIKEAEKNRIFDKGFTGSNGRSRTASTGMGLYLCNKLCTRLEHKLSVISKESEGTEIIIVE